MVKACAPIVRKGNKFGEAKGGVFSSVFDGFWGGFEGVYFLVSEKLGVCGQCKRKGSMDKVT